MEKPDFDKIGRQYFPTILSKHINNGVEKFWTEHVEPLQAEIEMKKVYYESKIESLQAKIKELEEQNEENITKALEITKQVEELSGSLKEMNSAYVKAFGDRKELREQNQKLREALSRVSNCNDLATAKEYAQQALNPNQKEG